MIKAIETRYAGYRFRSRLEARWAIYLDKLGIKFMYELQGYEVFPGVWYLPDFYLPQWDCYAEVKPTELTKIEFDKCCALPKRCILLDGMPEWDRGYYLTGTDIWDEDTYTKYKSGTMYGRVELGNSAIKGEPWFLLNDEPGRLLFLIEAENAAKSARFEHGEAYWL